MHSVFFSYSHKDENLRDQLEVHLSEDVEEELRMVDDVARYRFAGRHLLTVHSANLGTPHSASVSASNPR